MTNIQQAVVILGQATLQGLVLSCATKAVYGKVSPEVTRMWDHSFGDRGTLDAGRLGVLERSGPGARAPSRGALNQDPNG